MAKVLIVDDSSLGRKYLKRILLKAGHEVVAEAENGEEGILEYKRIKPELVAMDVDMPGIGGLEASKRILKDFPEARIVIISAHEQNDLKEEMGKYGLKHYIIKPVTEDNIGKAFQNALADVVTVAKTKVCVTHHSVLNIFAAVKKGEEGKILSLEIEKGIPFNDFNEEDPIVLGYKTNGAQIISLCKILNADTVDRYLKVETIDSCPLIVETAYQNLPVSMYMDIRAISTRKRYPAVIKAFKVNETVVDSKADFNIGEKLNFDILTRNKLLSIDGEVISKTQGRKSAEYIIKMSFDDYNMKKIYVTYLQGLASSMEKTIDEICHEA